MAWVNVQVIEQKTVLIGLDDEEPDELTIGMDSTSVLRRKGSQEALSRSPGIEPSDALKAFTHGFNAQSHQRLSIAGASDAVRDRRFMLGGAAHAL